MLLVAKGAPLLSATTITAGYARLATLSGQFSGLFAPACPIGLSLVGCIATGLRACLDLMWLVAIQAHMSDAAGRRRARESVLPNTDRCRTLSILSFLGWSRFSYFRGFVFFTFFCVVIEAETDRAVWLSIGIAECQGPK